MMALFFGYLTHPIHKIKRFSEVREQEGFCKMVLFHDLPVRQLIGEPPQFHPFERRNTAPAGNACFIRETYFRFTHISLSSVLRHRAAAILFPAAGAGYLRHET